MERCLQREKRADKVLRLMPAMVEGDIDDGTFKPSTGTVFRVTGGRPDNLLEPTRIIGTDRLRSISLYERTKDLRFQNEAMSMAILINILLACR